MKGKRRWLLCPLIIVVLLLCAIPAYADIPTIPHAFYGTVTISGSAASVGTVVTAKVGGVQCGSITTTVAGQYGGSGAFDEKLTVSGEIATGATISFFVNGVDTGRDYDYAFSPGAVTELNLAVTDVTPPTVASTSPASGATGVAVTTTVTATFSEAMNASTITTSSFTLDSVSGGVSYNSGTYTATFTPDSDLAYETTYTATLSTAITDAAGNPLASAYSWSFTTALPDTTAPSVTITAFSPDPTNDNTPTFTGTATDTESNIAGVEYKVDDGYWVVATASDGAFDSLSEGYTFTTAALADGAHTVYVRATDVAHNTTAEAGYASDSFTVDTTPPTVFSTSPAADETGVAVGTVVTATFSEAMNASTITTSSFTLAGVSGSVSYNSGTYTATFTPDSDLAYETTYTASLSTAITDAAGNPLALAYSWSFTTVTSVVVPGDATGDGVVDARDITKVERVIATLDAETPGADANQDGVVNALDITKVERIIVGLD